MTKEKLKMEQIQQIKVDKIKINPNQPRKEFDKESLIELADSIKSNGLINPIQVKQSGKGFELICGERRLKAYKILKQKEIKAIVKTYNSKQAEMVESLIENLHRTDLSSTEKEDFIDALWKTGKYESYPKLAAAIGLSSATVRSNILSREVRNKMKLLKDISTRTITDTCSIKDVKDRKQVLEKIRKQEVNSADARLYSKIIVNSPPDVKQALLSNVISIKQAETLSKITEDNLRKEVLKAHKDIREIDKKIDKNIEKKIINPNKKQNLIKVKELISNFRYQALENQNALRQSVQSLKKCVAQANLMDAEQLEQLTHYQELFEINLSSVLEISESLKKTYLNNKLNPWEKN